MTKPMAVANKGRMYVCTSWCPFCGVTQHVTADAKTFPNTAPADIWRLDADKIYEFVSKINDLGYLPKHAGSDDLAWTFPQMYSDGTFSTNVFNIAVGRGLTVRAPECYILRDEQLTVFDTKLLDEFDQLGIHQSRHASQVRGVSGLMDSSCPTVSRRIFIILPT